MSITKINIYRSKTNVKFCHIWWMNHLFVPPWIYFCVWQFQSSVFLLCCLIRSPSAADPIVSPFGCDKTLDQFCELVSSFLVHREFGEQLQSERGNQFWTLDVKRDEKLSPGGVTWTPPLNGFNSELHRSSTEPAPETTSEVTAR